MTLNFMLSILISYIMALLSMAFYTLLERKTLAYFQLRKGPNKVSTFGLPQPFADAIKLFSKEQTMPTNSNKLPFMFAPTMALMLAMLLWTLYPYTTPAYFIKFGILAFLCISSLSVYTTLAAGWTSNSKYALLGAMRGIAQTISYEISMALILLTPLIIISSFNFSMMHLMQQYPLILLCPPLFITWFITTLAETNRTPFDLAEGESELVSGFNIEYSSGMFALIFMAEYMSILIMSILTTVIFLSFTIPLFMEMFLTIKAITISFMFLWLRGTLPRMRYDQLMLLTWKSFLPFALSTLIMSLILFM
uniref:NADH-ubiquinone oxidoreductase chain 1 n=1 Tax=Neoamphitrite affinis TaxID=2716569 RepID=A0A8F9RRN5_9ANNE|nr:NADH dehydrogenase subunit 1 [Neoamphitrite affinis]